VSRMAELHGTLRDQNLVEGTRTGLPKGAGENPNWARVPWVATGISVDSAVSIHVLLWKRLNMVRQRKHEGPNKSGHTAFAILPCAESFVSSFL
jgi:hypothetical protein